jgi:predicted RNA-binding protein
MARKLMMMEDRILLEWSGWKMRTTGVEEQKQELQGRLVSESDDW